MKAFTKRLLSAVLALTMLIGMFVVTSSAALATVPSNASIVGFTYSDDTLSTEVDPLSYNVGDTMVFGFKLKSGSTYYTAPYLYYKVQRDDGVTEEGWASFNDSGVAVVKTTMTCPGFAYVTAYPTDEEGSTSNLMTSRFDGSAGADVTNIKTVYAAPGDLESYWQSVLAQLDEGCEIEYVYDLTSKVNGYYLYEIQLSCPEDEYYNAKLHRNSWGSIKETSRPEDNHVSLWLSIPKTASSTNQMPISMAYTGYDWTIPAIYGNSTSVDYGSLCSNNSIKISVSAHSIPMPHNVASDAAAADVTNGEYNSHYYYTTLKEKYGYTDWHGQEYDATKDNNYFKYMLMRDVQAVRFATKFFGAEGGTSSLVDVSSWTGLWNGTDISVSGASQGGYQTVAIAALCPEVTSFSAGVPWFADESVKSPDSLRMKPTACRNFAYVDGLRYVDIASLATMIDPDCVGNIVMGLGDTLCPPSTIFSAYNNMKCSVSVTAYQNAGHGASNKGSGNGTISKTKNTETEKPFWLVNISDVFDASFLNLLRTSFVEQSEYESTDSGSSDSIVVGFLEINPSMEGEYNYDQLLESLKQVVDNPEDGFDCIALVLTDPDVYKVTDIEAAAYAISNDPNYPNMFVVSDGKSSFTTEEDAKELAYSLAACLGGGNMPTPDDGEIVLCDSNGKLDESFYISSGESNEKIVAAVTVPAWVAQKGVRTELKNATLNGGKLTVDTSAVGSGTSASVTLKTGRYAASYTVTEPITNTFKCGENLRMDLGESGTLYIRGTGTAFKVYDVNGDVLNVNWNAPTTANFYGIRNSVKKIVFEAPVTSIKGYALDCFDNCTTVELPKSYVSANGEIFHGMQSLTTVYTTGQTPENGVVNFSNISSVSGWTFVNTPIKKAVLGKNLKEFGQQDVFYGCTKLEEVTLPKGLASISAHTFYNCTSLKSIEIPYGCEVADTAFDGCKNITTVTVNNESTTAKTAWLDKLTGLTSIKCVEDSSADVWAKAKGWTSGNEITYITPDVETEGTITVSGWNAEETWSYDNATKTLTLGGSFYDYDLSAFANDTSYNNFLKFYGDKVKTIVVNATSGKLWYSFATLGLPNVERIEVKQGRYHAQNTALLAGMTKLKTFGQIGKITENVIDYSFVTTVQQSGAPNGWFKGLSSAVEIRLPKAVVHHNDENGVTYPIVPENAFEGCTSLTKVTIPAYITSIGANAFKNCTALKDITVPETVTTIDDTAFDGCTLTMRGVKGSAAETFANAHDNITFAEPVVEISYIVKDMKIGENLCYRISEDASLGGYLMEIYGTGTSLTPCDTNGVVIPGGYGWDSSKATYTTYASNIKKIKFLTENLTSISQYAFQNISAEVELAKGMKTLSSSAFNGMKSLNTIYTTGQTRKVGTANLSNITSIGDYVFVDNRFTEIIFSDNLTNIGFWSLGSWGSHTCETMLEIPASVTTVAENAFKNHTSLTTVKFYGKDTAISANAFVDCTNLTTIYGYKGSTAETFAEEKGYTFVSLVSMDDLLDFAGFSLRTTKYNGLRAEFHFDKDKAAELEESGYTVVEFGTLVSATDSIETGKTLSVKKDNGSYVVDGSTNGVICKIMENGAYTSYLANCQEFTNEVGNSAYKYFVTIVNYDATTYNKTARFRGYAVVQDAEGNETVVYADLYDAEGNDYSVQSLDSMVTIQFAAGLITTEDISYIDVIRFRATTPVIPSEGKGDNEIEEDKIY